MSSNGDLDFERSAQELALVTARVEAQEMQNLAVAGRLIEREAVELAVADIVARTKMMIQALPGKLSAAIAAELGIQPEKALPLLRSAVSEILQTLTRQEAEKSDRVGQAVKAGVELGMIYGSERTDGPNPQNQRSRASARPRPVPPDGGGDDRPSGRKRRTDAAFRTAEPPVSRNPKPPRRRGRPMGSTT